eukprot:g2957.t1
MFSIKNKNVRLSLIFTFVASLTWGISYGAVLSGYLFDLAGADPKTSNRYVGLAEAVQGIACLFSALPSGWASDKLGRAPILRLAGFIGLFGTALLFFVVLSQWDFIVKKRFTCFCVALSISGLFNGMWSSPLESIFADSVATGERSKYSTVKFTLSLVGRIFGPLLSIIVIYTAHKETHDVITDGWTIKELIVVMLSGFGLGIVCNILLLFFSDKDTLGDESQSHTEPLVREQSINSSVDEEVVSYESTNDNFDPTYNFLCLFRVTRKHIALFSVCSDIIMGIASGMTIKFFPLWLRNEVGLTLVEVQCVYIGTFILMAFLAHIAQIMSKRLGRVQVAVSCSTLGICCLVALALSGSYNISYKTIKTSTGITRNVEVHGLWHTASISVPLYIIRTALMNCCRGLRKSVVMDYVEKKDRGKWNALDGVTRLGWSGSAFLGGWLIDKFEYGVTFYATAALQFTGVLLWMFLLPLVPIEKKRDTLLQ